MSHLKKLLVLIMWFTTIIAVSQNIKPQDVKQDKKRFADWQIEHYKDVFSNNKPHNPLDWINGALYVGMVKWAEMADDDTYYEWLKKIGEEHDWKLWDRKYHADDHTIGQMYCELSRKYGDEKMIEPTREQFDFIMMHPSKSKLNWRTPYHQDRWNWCDALFMSPPVWAKLYKITGEKKISGLYGFGI